jgi:uncharacterized protein YbbC (DUF1343 family)
MLTVWFFVLYFIVLLGIDTLEASNFRPIKDMRIGLLTNISCCDSKLKPTISVFENSRNFELTAIFAPEHGIYSAAQDQVSIPHARYGKKIAVFSLYGKHRKPTLNAIKQLDAIVIDLPDIGTRYYTFLWSAMLMIEQAAHAQRKVFILDRPNPLNGTIVQGPVIDPGFESFVGLYSIAIRHGMTIGEICNMLNDGHRLDADIAVIKMKGWRRNQYMDNTKPHWTMPSPNMPYFATALVYPGMCLLEGTNVSEGRGTTRPFEIFGAPWLDPYRLADRLNEKCIPGVRFRPTYFQPTFHKYQGTLCGGIHIYVANRTAFNPVTAGLEIIRSIKRLFPRHFRWRQPPYEFERKKRPFDILIGNSWIRKAIDNAKTTNAIQTRWQPDLKKFKTARKKYLLYT